MLKKKIGVIADTHGLLRTEIAEMFKDVDLIIHAGDVGKPQVLEELKTIAPVVAVKGNVDKGNLVKKLPSWENVDIGNKSIYVLHDIDRMDIEPKGADIDIVIYGHSHKASEERVEGVLYLNPGSAGPKRFSLPITVAILIIENDNIIANFIDL